MWTAECEVEKKSITMGTKQKGIETTLPATEPKKHYKILGDLHADIHKISARYRSIGYIAENVCNRCC